MLPRILRKPSRRKQMSVTQADDHVRLVMVAHMVGWRIISGISDETMAQRMGYLDLKLPENKKARQKAIAAGVAKLHMTERTLGDGRLATVQRYARGLGRRFDMVIGMSRRPRITPRRYCRLVNQRWRYVANKQHERQRRRTRRVCV